MKQKTATLTIYKPFGVSPTHKAINLSYRRDCLFSFSGNDVSELVVKATRYAHNLGFTQVKIEDISKEVA